LALGGFWRERWQQLFAVVRNEQPVMCCVSAMADKKHI